MSLFIFYTVSVCLSCLKHHVSPEGIAPWGIIKLCCVVLYVYLIIARTTKLPFQTGRMLLQCLAKVFGPLELCNLLPLKCGKRSQSSRGPNTFARHCIFRQSFVFYTMPDRGTLKWSLCWDAAGHQRPGRFCYHVNFRICLFKMKTSPINLTTQPILPGVVN